MAVIQRGFLGRHNKNNNPVWVVLLQWRDHRLQVCNCHVQIFGFFIPIKLILFRVVCSFPDGKRQLAHTYCYMMLYGAGHKKSSESQTSGFDTWWAGPAVSYVYVASILLPISLNKFPLFSSTRFFFVIRLLFPLFFLKTLTSFVFKFQCRRWQEKIKRRQKFKKEKRKKKSRRFGGVGQFVCLSLLRSVGTHNRVATGCRRGAALQ